MKNALSDLIGTVEGITCHSAEVKPGYVFVAIEGRSTDGNLYIKDAVARGAIAIVTDKPGNLSFLKPPVVNVPDARWAFSQLAASFYGDPSRFLSLVGVSGSNGKTTITHMLEHIFSQAGYKAGLIGTVQVKTGKKSFPSILTTPDAASIHKYLAEMRQNGVTHAAMEVSAQGVAMKRVEHVQFSGGIMSNICPDHLDFYGDFSSYLAAKQDFLRLIPNHAPLVINQGDLYCSDLAVSFPGPVITCAVDSCADISARILHLTSYSSNFVLELSRPLTTSAGAVIPACLIPVRLTVPGRHNVENALLAGTAALLQDIPLPLVVAALGNFKGVKRRMNVFHIQGLTVIDDTALNPGSIEAVFETVQAFRYRHLIVVNAIRGKRGPAINAMNAATLAGIAKELPLELIITSSSEQVPSSDTVLPEEQLAFLSTLDALGVNYTYSVTLSAALQTALNYAQTGDLVVLIGAQGMDAGRNVFTNILVPDADALCGGSYLTL
ncbi:MAG TPA: UDP-N-acetylmuramyl-tripeptide synthetase [Methylomusa anaerophila]|uniref:UDP-N-acetylmuramoyl-L-alanyl-D-glutamate--2,6-diaminopimelate ligase n=1 Tax=Methylomusa anaerophila TaxID=1930071 RepID=A0A348AJF7_9FIRM|nr:UDP-N-acetylmuramyl-tripeptide synthetase [Methylomusa anaerophila]BBB91205.1 UDP-N-acetylmuramoyl-L-alanyl-D-glutamate--2,6-diaminopimelate ligase [Methylomusa anaerophila]HML89800.1 UDP-N-acetylmuramyl-tripeptide synthetase [Methylomusa anaerophila]